MVFDNLSFNHVYDIFGNISRMVADALQVARD
jgi:hypothetical protein